MRLDDAERERLFERLSRHAADGRLDIPELERRVAVVAAAETREEAAAVLADLPPLPAAPASGRRPGTGRGGTAHGDPPPGAVGGRPRWGRGHGDADAVGADWRPTAERFRDPKTGRVMRVWEDTGGGRHYVADDDQA